MCQGIIRGRMAAEKFRCLDAVQIGANRDRSEEKVLALFIAHRYSLIAWEIFCYPKESRVCTSINDIPMQVSWPVITGLRVGQCETRSTRARKPRLYYGEQVTFIPFCGIFNRPGGSLLM
jgi:hypothetical protein